MKQIRFYVHQFIISRRWRGSLPLRGIATRHAGAHQSAPLFVWLSLVAILAATLVLTSVAGTGTWYGRDDARKPDHRPNTPPAAHAAHVYEYGNTLFGAVESGRRGVSEQSGRRGVTEQSGRSSPEPNHVVREPMPPGGRLRPIIVEALLNRQLSVPLMLDTGASYTVLTRQTAIDLGMTGLERLPKQRFLTPGGPILSPVTTLKSIRVAAVEARDVAVAIDVEGHLPVGLLGMTFMRHFKVTVDQAQGHVKFERR